MESFPRKRESTTCPKNRISTFAGMTTLLLTCCLELQTIQVGIQAVLRQQLNMRAFLDDAALVQHDDAICMFDSR